MLGVMVEKGKEGMDGMGEGKKTKIGELVRLEVREM